MVDGLVRFLGHGLLVQALQRRSGQGHEASSSRFEDTKRSNQFEERVDPGLLS